MNNQLKQPAFIITLMLALISIIVNFVLYQKSIKARDLSFQITQPIAKVFDSENATSKIKLLENDSILITDNIYLLTGKIWNSGNLTILSSDVRKELTIELDISNRILDYEIINERESGISNFKLDLISQNKLSLNWDYFDPSYGLVFQIMFLGKDDNPNFQLNGKILEVSKFKEIDFVENSRAVNNLFGIFISFTGIIISVFVSSGISKIKINKTWWMLMFSFIILVILAVLVYYSFKYFVFFDKIPL